MESSRSMNLKRMVCPGRQGLPPNHAFNRRRAGTRLPDLDRVLLFMAAIGSGLNAI